MFKTVSFTEYFQQINIISTPPVQGGPKK